ncbi:MAG: STAS domain-containing protein [Bacteroidales bacterium]|nr:STAS domain-containing protein [Bacteroidales bacterium]MDZ4204403.1 STAS domain-containing protein [Bacteroidales bacterium]
MITFDFKEPSGILHCNLTGRMGADVCLKLGPEIQNHIAARKSEAKDPIKVVFNLQEVDFIASGFIRICIETIKSINRENFSIVNTNPLIKRTFKIAGLDETLNVS